MTNFCPQCKNVEFDIIIEPDTFIRKNVEFTIDVEYSECKHCGYELIFVEQIKRNDLKVLSKWKEIDEKITKLC